MHCFICNFWTFFHMIGILQRYKMWLSVAVYPLFIRLLFSILSFQIFSESKLKSEKFLPLIICHCYKLVSCQASLEAVKMGNYVAV